MWRRAFAASLELRMRKKTDRRPKATMPPMKKPTMKLSLGIPKNKTPTGVNRTWAYDAVTRTIPVVCQSFG